MRAVIQRVRRGSVTVNNEKKGEIARGVVILLGVHCNDSASDAEYLANKCVHLRIFADDQGNMNRSLLEVGGEALIVSQFTLYADTRKGRRPSFIQAAAPEISEPLYEKFVAHVRALGVPTATGEFGAMMQVEILNDGPVTIIVESK